MSTELEQMEEEIAQFRREHWRLSPRGYVARTYGNREAREKHDLARDEQTRDLAMRLVKYSPDALVKCQILRSCPSRKVPGRMALHVWPVVSSLLIAFYTLTGKPHATIVLCTALSVVLAGMLTVLIESDSTFDAMVVTATKLGLHKRPNIR